MNQLSDVNVEKVLPLIAPKALKSNLKIHDIVTNTVVAAREEMRSIMERSDPRLLVIVGPCSIHDTEAALQYANKLEELQKRYRDRLCIIMRTYFEKPRTRMGWKGLIYDPHLNGTNAIPTGLHKARQLLLDINALGLPCATEFLDPLVPQYIDDLVAWAAIGARTTESQTHREMASGLSMPVGFKNSTEGNFGIAIDAMHSARGPHAFIGIDQNGQSALIKTRGNPFGHIILRGGNGSTNFDAQSIASAASALEQAELPPVVMVDCSHANSHKKHQEQIDVFKSVVQQRADGNHAIIGLMVESNLRAKNQPIPEDLSQLQYGVSITDDCIGWQTTEESLGWAYEQLTCCQQLAEAVV